MFKCFVAKINASKPETVSTSVESTSATFSEAFCHTYSYWGKTNDEVFYVQVGRDSSVGIAAGCGFVGPGIEFGWG